MQGLRFAFHLLILICRFSDEENAQVKSRLLELISNNVGVVANRGFTSLELLLSYPDDVLNVVELLYHPDRTVRVFLSCFLYSF